MKDLGPSGEQATGRAGGGRPTWSALAAGTVLWAGLLVGLYAVFWAIAQSLEPSPEGDNNTLLTLFAAGILFATQVIAAIAGASTVILLDRHLARPGRAAAFFAVAACAVGLIGTLLYVALPAREGTFGMDASAGMLTLFLMCVAVDGATAGGASYFVGNTLEKRRQSES